MSVELKVNGQSKQLEVAPGESLLDALRDRVGVKSPKDGCQPQGQCGCCLVLIDGQPKTSCATEAAKAHGKSILTLEGIPEEERAITAKAFAVAAGLQCGFCIPGIALRAKHLIDKNPNPTRDEIAKAIDGHLCRCTGYVKLIDAIELIAKARRGEPIPEPETDAHVGASFQRYKAGELALGERPFVADMEREGMLHGALLLSPHPRAKLLSVDVSKAKALPGVRVVATAADVPGQRWNGLLYEDWPAFVAIGEEARCVGDVVAAVAADDVRVARKAVSLIEATWEVLPAVLDPAFSLSGEAPQVNPAHPNLLQRSIIQRGDADAALKASAHVVSGEWKTQRIEHLFLETECALAEPLPGGKLGLYTQGQGIFDDRRQCARLLGIPEDDLYVELVPNGGAFGGKEDMSVQAQTALLAFLAQKPVKLALTREESIRIHPKRHPITMQYEVGCDAEGRLTAVRARLLGDSGAYASVGGKVLERAAGHACGPYRVPNVDVIGDAAYTNHPPCGAMRGFGVNQTSFAMEGCLDLLAKKVGIDAYEIRARNVLVVGDVFSTGQILDKAVGVKATLEAVKDAYYAAKKAGKAVGIACGLKNSGIGNGVAEWGKCRLVVEKDLTISLYNGYTEMGQGLLTILTQFASDVSGVPGAAFRPKVDSTFALGCGQTTGSRATLHSGRAVKSAALKLRAALDAGKTLGDLVGETFAADEVIDDTTPLGKTPPGKKIKTHTTFGYATQVCILDANGRVEKFVAAHDVGRAVNPALCTGQIEGAIHMGLGYALTEELPCVDGMPVTFKLRDIGALRARDMPEVEVILVEDPEPEGPFGAKGVGEIGLVPTAGAVAGALEMFDGIRRRTLPMKDSPASKAMSVGRIKGDRSTFR
jgi:xanthine dehydrogenase molybdenum-binding subunit